MRYILFLILFPGIALADPNFSGTWDVTAQIVSDNCFGEYGKITSSALKITQRAAVLTYKRNDGRKAKGVALKDKTFTLALKYDEIIGSFAAPTALTYKFSKIKNGDASFVFTVHRRLEDGYLCFVKHVGVASKR